MLHDALLYDEREDGTVQCNLCAHYCEIRPGHQGLCRVRENQDGKLKTLVYGNLISQNPDPIEKKPLYHFLPGSRSYSIAMPGCNFRCEWCQNWQISQMPRIMEMPQTERWTPDEIVWAAIRTGCKSVAYTYTEPTIFFEYSYDVAKLAAEKGLKNVYVTNGFMSAGMLAIFHPYLDAANVDIKAFHDETYRRLMGGRLEPVLESCRRMKAFGIWLEITTLIVPGVNDDPQELENLARFIYEDLGPETPWHLSRFYPQYKMNDLSPTAEALLYETKEMGHSLGLDYIYIGNVHGENNTYCKQCKKILIRRDGYHTRISDMDKTGTCTHCGARVEGIWDSSD